jgi:ubiquinone/menaquinone biosynthesis C-methylase UbiE
MIKIDDSWDSGDPYEYFMGRWSKLMAPVFLEWLNCPANLLWLDIGCGTGALSEAIFKHNKPAKLSCVDPSSEFLEKAMQRLSGNVDFSVGNASDIPRDSQIFDVVVSGLALNFFPDVNSAFAEMKRILKPNGTLAAYVWDYNDRMDFLKLFWDIACELDPDAQKLHEGFRFPICHPFRLVEIFEKAGLSDIKTSNLDISTVFRDFNDYWNPFLGGQGPAPSYVATLNEDKREQLKKALYKKLPIESDGSIKLLARAIGIQGTYKQ